MASSPLAATVGTHRLYAVIIRDGNTGPRCISSILPSHVSLHFLDESVLTNMSTLPGNTLLFNMRSLASLRRFEHLLPARSSSPRSESEVSTVPRVHLWHLADERGTSTLSSAYDRFAFASVIRDYYFGSLPHTRRRVHMLGGHACAAQPPVLHPRTQVYALFPWGVTKESPFIADGSALLPMRSRPIVCAWTGYLHGSARKQLKVFLEGSHRNAMWARAHCHIHFNDKFAVGSVEAYHVALSQTVFYLNPEGNTRALDNIRWGEIMRHAAIPVNVDTFRFGQNASEGHDVFTGRPPPGLYASRWADAFEQMRAILESADGAQRLQAMQREVIEWRATALGCVRQDVGALLAGVAIDAGEATRATSRA